MYKIIWPVLFPKETASKFGGVSLIEKFQAKKGGMKTQFEKKILKWGECIIPIRYK